MEGWKAILGMSEMKMGEVGDEDVDEPEETEDWPKDATRIDEGRLAGGEEGWDESKVAGGMGVGEEGVEVEVGSFQGKARASRETER